MNYWRRLKAFLVDMFMINMPILYVATYAVMGSKEAFQSSPTAIFVCSVLYGLVVSVFIAKSGQTPGLKYVGLKIVRASLQAEISNDGQNPNNEKTQIPNNEATQIPNSERNLNNKNSNKADSGVGIIRALLRYAAWLLSTLILVGLIVGKFRKDKRDLQDIIAGTKIIAVAQKQ